MRRWFWVILISVFILLFIFVGNSLSKESIDATVSRLLTEYNLSDRTDLSQVLTVGEGKQYASIQDAVDHAKNGDVIVVFPGVYEEAVCAADKTLSIIGESKSNCKITYPNGNYHEPPLEMGSGLLANITIHATQQEQLPDTVAKAYALHSDYDISKDNSFDIINVDFINDDYQVAGIGLRQNFTLRFQNCSFMCKSGQNAFFCHDDPVQKQSTGQTLIVENCHFSNNGASSTIRLQSQQEEGSQIQCQWISNTVENKGSDQLFSVYLYKEKIFTTTGLQDLSFWENSEQSADNTLALLNYTP